MSDSKPTDPAPPRFLGPNVAGTWYPSDPDALRAQLDTLLEDPDPSPGSPTVLTPLLALIAPHAGLTYSGAVAASVFRHVRSAMYDRVILLGPSHHVAFQGAALPDAELYRTPLGDVPLATRAIERLGVQPGLAMNNAPFSREHSLEAEIPFLQRALSPGWRLIPVLIGAGSSGAGNQQVADALRLLLQPGTLIVVSSDFTHYGPRFDYVPFDTDVPARLKNLDLGAVGKILSCDTEGFDEYTRRTGATICGRGAIDVLLRLLPAGVRAGLEAYDTSGRITGDWAHSVSYAGVTFRSDA